MSGGRVLGRGNSLSKDPEAEKSSATVFLRSRGKKKKTRMAGTSEQGEEE